MSADLPGRDDNGLRVRSWPAQRPGRHPFLPTGMAEEDADKVCAILPAESPPHWDTKELLAVQKEDHQTLAAKERLTSTPDFSWPEKRGEGR